jgi:glycine oxidase
MVIAAGANGALLRAIDPVLARSIRPVKGQIMRLDQSAMPLLGHVVRTPDMYLAPKSSGMMVLGASSEERGFDPHITAGEIFELLRAAWECVPGVYELPIAETRVGFRPATIDHMPLLGPSGADHLWLAMGYYRHGILFSPYAADLLARRVLGAGDSPWLATFSPERFHEAATERGGDRSPLADHP